MVSPLIWSLYQAVLCEFTETLLRLLLNTSVPGGLTIITCRLFPTPVKVSYVRILHGF